MNYIRNLILITYLILAGYLFWIVAQYKWSALAFITMAWLFFKIKKRLQHGT